MWRGGGEEQSFDFYLLHLNFKVNHALKILKFSLVWVYTTNLYTNICIVRVCYTEMFAAHCLQSQLSCHFFINIFHYQSDEDKSALLTPTVPYSSVKLMEVIIPHLFLKHFDWHIHNHLTLMRTVIEILFLSPFSHNV